MSWSLQVIGKVPNARTVVASRREEFRKHSSFEGVEACDFIIAQLDKIPTAVNPPPDNGYSNNGVIIDGSGHADSSTRNCSISIRGCRIAPDPDPLPCCDAAPAKPEVDAPTTTA